MSSKSFALSGLSISVEKYMQHLAGMHSRQIEESTTFDRFFVRAFPRPLCSLRIDLDAIAILFACAREGYGSDTVPEHQAFLDKSSILV
jgi:hypothetical protein